MNRNITIKRIIKYPLSKLKNGYLDIRSFYYLNKNSKKVPNKEKIKVGFIVQVPEVWDKEVDIYDEMKGRKDFEVIMLVVPPYDLSSKKIIMSYKDNYFLKKYPEAVKAITKSGVIDIEKLNLDYLFYQRPYDHYLPKELRSCHLIKYTKCCYVPYGYAGSDVFNDGNSNKEFFRNITNVFLESDYMRNILENKFRLKTKLGTQHFYSVGYPDLEKYFDYKTSDKIESIIWTPRWSYDQRIGGSHFIEYKDILFDLKEKYPYNSFIFRPHPLMFGELKNKQLASQTEIDKFLEKIKEYSIEYDHDTMMDQAIEKADLMITDYSSIIINYFLTGKPIIYCKAQYELNEEYSKIEKCMYVAKNKTDIQRYVEMLLSGNDPLRESRKKLIESYSNKHSGATKRITDILINEI